MTLRRPVRILLAAGLLCIVSVVNVLATPRGLNTECADGQGFALILSLGFTCYGGATDPASILQFVTPIVSLGLALGLVLLPPVASRPLASASLLLGAVWIQPLLGGSDPFVEATTLSVLAGAPFLVMSPIGAGSGLRTRLTWIAVLIVALFLLAVDYTFSNFMASAPLAERLGMLPVLVTVLVAGVLAPQLRRLEVAQAQSAAAGATT